MAEVSFCKKWTNLSVCSKFSFVFIIKQIVYVWMFLIIIID